MATETKSKVSWTKKDGASMKKARRTLGLSQADVAANTGVTPSRIAEIENAEVHGRRTGPSTELTERLAEFFTSGKAEEIGAAKAAKNGKSHTKVKAKANGSRKQSQKARVESTRSRRTNGKGKARPKAS